VPLKIVLKKNNYFLIKKAIFAQSKLHYGFGNSRTPSLKFKSFSGAIYDSNQMSIYVQVYDSDGAFSIFNLEKTTLTVAGDLENSNFTSFTQRLVTGDLSIETNRILDEGAYLPSIQEIQRMASMLNEQSLDDKQKLKEDTPLFPRIYGPLWNFTSNEKFLPNDTNITRSQYELNRNRRAATRAHLIKYINQISVYDMDGVRTQVGMLSMLTSQTDEITRQSEVVQKIGKSLNIETYFFLFKK
jgi:hypothetical protein